MADFQRLYEYAVNRFGSPQALEARLPQPLSNAALRAVSDDRYLSLLTQRIFRAGLKHSLVDAKWPAFEEAFFGFVPEKVVLMGAEHLERLMADRRLIRHLGKLASVPRNAQMLLDIAATHGSFAAWLADWPGTDIVGLWRYLARHGQQVGGLSAPRFLRMAGKDTFILSPDVLAALKGLGVIERPPTSQAALATVQAQFNQWQAETGRPLAQLSMLLALSADH